MRDSTVSWAIKTGNVIIPKPEGIRAKEKMRKRHWSKMSFGINTLASFFCFFSPLICLDSTLAQPNKLI